MSPPRHPVAPHDVHRGLLARLMARPDVPIDFERRYPLHDLAPVKDFVSNIASSSAGAGSGDFHVYRANRRREALRLRIMDVEAKSETDQKEFDDERAAVLTAEQALTAKRRAKRLKRRNRKSLSIPSNPLPE